MFVSMCRKANACIKISHKTCRYSQTANELLSTITSNNNNVSEVDTKLVRNDHFQGAQFEKKSSLEKCTEDISHIAPYIKPTFNFAAYINKSETLQQLLKLGVNLHKLEKKNTVPEFIMRLDFEKDIKPYIQFFYDIGLTLDDIGNSITKNPFILKQDIDHLKVRMNYLLCKKFNKEMILRILNRNPFWLMYSTERIDKRLGFFQKEYALTGDEVRELATKQPMLITYSISHVKLNNFALKEEMGFSPEEIKAILLKQPKIFMKNQQNMLLTYECVINEMQVPLQMLVEWPGILTCRSFKVKQRHMFLKTLGKAQYNPKIPNYISPFTLVTGTDGDFAVNTAKSSLQAYNAFLKTL